jgi:hypothetical protein
LVIALVICAGVVVSEGTLGRSYPAAGGAWAIATGDAKEDVGHAP